MAGHLVDVLAERAVSVVTQWTSSTLPRSIAVGGTVHPWEARPGETAVWKTHTHTDRMRTRCLTFQGSEGARGAEVKGHRWDRRLCCRLRSPPSLRHTSCPRAEGWGSNTLAGGLTVRPHTTPSILSTTTRKPSLRQLHTVVKTPTKRHTHHVLQFHGNCNCPCACVLSVGHIVRVCVRGYQLVSVCVLTGARYAVARLHLFGFTDAVLAPSLRRRVVAEAHTRDVPLATCQGTR